MSTTFPFEIGVPVAPVRHQLLITRPIAGMSHGSPAKSGVSSGGATSVVATAMKTMTP